MSHDTRASGSCELNNVWRDGLPSFGWLDKLPPLNDRPVEGKSLAPWRLGVGSLCSCVFGIDTLADHLAG